MPAGIVRTTSAITSPHLPVGKYSSRFTHDVVYFAQPRPCLAARLSRVNPLRRGLGGTAALRLASGVTLLTFTPASEPFRPFLGGQCLTHQWLMVL